MELKPFIAEKTDHKIRFGLKAVRVRKVEKEYLPTSENFRVEIYNSDGRLIRNSNFNQNYFQAIGDVEPDEPGESTEFFWDWEIQDNYGKQALSGKYRARMIIPASPENYVSYLDFEI